MTSDTHIQAGVKRNRTGEVLVRMGAITPQQLELTLRQQRASAEAGRHVFIGELLVRNKFASKEQVSFAVSRVAGGGTTGMFQLLLPYNVCRLHDVFPLRVEGVTLHVKAARSLAPAARLAILDASEVPATELKVIPTDLPDIARLLNSVMHDKHSFESTLLRLKNEEINGLLLKQAVDAILFEAVAQRASDVHMLKLPDPGAWVNFRIDGKLRPTHLVPERIMGAIFARIKNEAGMDISDSRTPQDGKLFLDEGGNRMEFRVGSQPIVGGERLAIRVLNMDSVVDLQALFPFQLRMNELFKDLANVTGKVGGLVLISGPTGGGKSTTLNALAKLFKRDEINLMTIEDPVEYELPFGAQIQRNALLKESFVDFERSLLRQDPDVIIIGEIRDKDTLEVALRFAKTGHLVISTLHAGSVSETVERVLQLCSGPTRDEALFDLANQLRVVVNQRLARRLCACATEHESVSAPRLSAEYGFRFHGRKVFKERGECPACNHTGYRGRIALHETVIIPKESSLRSAIGRLVADGAHRFGEVYELNGVTHITRQEVMARLLECHVMDGETVIQEVKAER